MSKEVAGYLIMMAVYSVLLTALHIIQGRKIDKFARAKKTVFYKTRQMVCGEWMAWGAFEPLTADQAMLDRAEPLHFSFSKTENGALFNLLAEMKKHYGSVYLAAGDFVNNGRQP